MINTDSPDETPIAIISPIQKCGEGEMTREEKNSRTTESIAALGNNMGAKIGIDGKRANHAQTGGGINYQP